MVDGRHGFAGLDRVAYQVDHRVTQADPIGREAAGDDHRIDIGEADGAGGEVGGHLLAVAAAVDVTGDRAHHVHGGACHGERDARRLEIHVVVFLFHQNHHAFAAQRSRISHAGSSLHGECTPAFGARHMIER